MLSPSSGSLPLPPGCSLKPGNTCPSFSYQFKYSFSWKLTPWRWGSLFFACPITAFISEFLFPCLYHTHSEDRPTAWLSLYFQCSAHSRANEFLPTPWASPRTPPLTSPELLYWAKSVETGWNAGRDHEKVRFTVLILGSGEKEKDLQNPKNSSQVVLLDPHYFSYKFLLWNPCVLLYVHCYCSDPW